MNVQRDPDAILAAWLEEGPTALPEPTRRAIAVTTRTTSQTRLPIWMPLRAPTLNGMTRYALAAVAVVAVVVGGLYFLRPGPISREALAARVAGAIGVTTAIGITFAVSVTHAFASAEP